MRWSFDIHPTRLAAEGAGHPTLKGFRVIIMHFLRRVFLWVPILVFRVKDTITVEVWTWHAFIELFALARFS